MVAVKGEFFLLFFFGLSFYMLILCLVVCQLYIPLTVYSLFFPSEDILQRMNAHTYTPFMCVHVYTLAFIIIQTNYISILKPLRSVII